jgi:hypothetical protein
MVSLSRSPYLPTLRSTFITRFIATMIDSAIRIPSQPPYVCDIWIVGTSSLKRDTDFPGSDTKLCKLADACDPGG